MRVFRHIPNFLTLSNLTCGTLGIIAVMGQNAPAAYFVLICCVFDFLDGFSARVLKVNSDIGKELDSLADIVSFGLLPSIFMFSLIQQQGGSTPLSYVALLIVIFSALRLAAFNLNDSQTNYFKGLPTPANALFFAFISYLPAYIPMRNNPYFLALLVVLFSILMVAPIRILSLKFKTYTWSGNRTRFIFLFLSIICIWVEKEGAFPLVILLYIGASLVETLVETVRPSV